MSQNEMFSIRQMIELTGLSEFTIRGWENRYQAFSPQRSDTGRREYHKKDIERALLIRELLKRGHKISKIASLPNQKLKALFENHQDENLSKPTKEKGLPVTQALELMSLQKWAELSDLLQNIKFKNPSDLIQLFFLPLLKELSQQINLGLVSVAQEHVLSSFLKEKIYFAISAIEKKQPPQRGPKKVRFILATPEGDYHEIGLLMAHLLIRSYGYTSLFLGPNTPAQDLAETALRFEASHLLIVSTVSKKDGARQNLLNFVSDVQKKAGEKLKILLAGPQVPPIPQDPASSLINVGSFYDLEEQLKGLGGKQ